MSANPKSDATEGGRKIYTLDADKRPSQWLLSSAASSGTVVGIKAQWYIPEACVVTQFQTRAGVFANTSSTDSVIAVQYRSGTTAAGSGTAVATATVDNGTATVGLEVESSNLSNTEIPAGSMVEVEMTTAGGATGLTLDYAVGIRFVRN